MVTDSYRTFVLEQLGRVRPVTHRRMFGGVGLYSAGLFFALIDDDRLYFKVDDTNRGEFEARQMEPFRPTPDETSMNYYEVPGDVLDDIEQLGVWMVRSISVAERKRASKRAPGTGSSRKPRKKARKGAKKPKG